MKWVSLTSLSVFLLAGCQQPTARLNAPPQGKTDHPSSLQPAFRTMTCNATLTDMCVADIHFAGTSAQLNGTGEVRMQRLTKILKTYGGELRYTTDLADQKLVQERINRLQDYLASAGVDMNTVSVHLGMPASSEMTAADAIKAQKAPTACGKDSGVSGGGNSGSGSGSNQNRGAGWGGGATK